MKKYYLTLLISIGVLQVVAQENTGTALNYPTVQADKIHALKIGQKVPEVFLHKILNYKDSSAKLSDFYKGKLLIIDFWATWCPPCIESLPVLDSLQKRMRDKVNIITVTYQTENEVKTSFKKHNNIAKSSLPFIIEDKILSRYFPYQFVPQEVWIDSHGIVRAITYSYEVTERNIDSLLDNGKMTLLTKKDSLTYDPKEYSNFQKNDILFRSVLAKTPLGIGIGWSDYKYVENYHKYYKRIYLTHRNALQLFYAAYTYGMGTLNFKRISFNISDSSKYIFPTVEKFNASDSLKILYTNYKQWLHQWESTNDYCYELIMPEYIKDTLFFKYMLQDLNRGFPITGSIEKRLIPCIIIKLTNPKNTSKLKTTGMKPYIYWSPNHDTLKGIQNQPLSTLVTLLNSFQKNDPVVDLTHYTTPVDMNFNMGHFFQSEKFSIDELRRDLAKYGLEVSREKRWVNVLVINQK